jgi:hypothetical protein
VEQVCQTIEGKNFEFKFYQKDYSIDLLDLKLLERLISSQTAKLTTNIPHYRGFPLNSNTPHHQSPVNLKAVTVFNVNRVINKVLLSRHQFEPFKFHRTI